MPAFPGKDDQRVRKLDFKSGGSARAVSLIVGASGIVGSAMLIECPVERSLSVTFESVSCDDFGLALFALGDAGGAAGAVQAKLTMPTAAKK